MLLRLIAFSIRFRGVVIALACLVVGYGIYVTAQARYDVYPEFAPPLVVIQTEAPGLSPEEVEALVTRPVENAISQGENDVLLLMREKFSITMEEHMSAEAKILWAKNTPNARSSILLVDDEETLLLSLAANLRKHGYDVVTATSVEKALEMLQKSIPSIIVSDLLFGEGEQTGIEFYQRVREDARLKDIPFLLMSGISDEFVVRAGMRLGVDNFIQKPFDLELLLATIEGKLKS